MHIWWRVHLGRPCSSSNRPTPQRLRWRWRWTAPQVRCRVAHQLRVVCTALLTSFGVHIFVCDARMLRPKPGCAERTLQPLRLGMSGGLLIPAASCVLFGSCTRSCCRVSHSGLRRGRTTPTSTPTTCCAAHGPPMSRLPGRGPRPPSTWRQTCSVQRSVFRPTGRTAKRSLRPSAPSPSSPRCVHGVVGAEKADVVR